MRNGRVMACALSTLLLGGCATQIVDSPQSASVMAGAGAIPKQSVAAERCLESYRLRNSRQGGFHRELEC